MSDNFLGLDIAKKAERARRYERPRPTSSQVAYVPPISSSEPSRSVGTVSVHLDLDKKPSPIATSASDGELDTHETESSDRPDLVEDIFAAAPSPVQEPEPSQHNSRSLVIDLDTHTSPTAASAAPTNPLETTPSAGQKPAAAGEPSSGWIIDSLATDRPADTVDNSAGSPVEEAAEPTGQDTGQSTTSESASVMVSAVDSDSAMNPWVRSAPVKKKSVWAMIVDRWHQFVAYLGRLVSSSNPATNSTGVSARWGARGAWNQVAPSWMQLSPRTDEANYWRYRQIVADCAFDYPYAVTVVNTKGGAGKTVTSTIVASIFAEVRAGQTAVLEACESPGTLAFRCPSGATDSSLTVTDFADAAKSLVSWQDFAAFGSLTAGQPLTVASPVAREELSADQINQSMDALARFYPMTVLDTANSTAHQAWEAAVDHADVAVVPCFVSADMIRSAASCIGAVRKQRRFSPAVVVAIDLPGRKTQNEALIDQLRDLAKEERVACLRVPYDPVIAEGGPITLDDLSRESQVAWMRVAARIAERLPSSLNLNSKKKYEGVPS